MSEKYRDETGDEREDRREANTERSILVRMPPELHQIVEDEIEPSTMNMGHDHGDTMECIEVAYPFILGYLAEHPEVLQEHMDG